VAVDLGERGERAVVAVDAGGTSLKHGIVLRGAGEALARGRVALDSAGTREAILAAFAAVVSRGMEAAAATGAVVEGIGVATPGPFDFAAGASLMEHKWAGIRGVKLRPELVRRCGLPAGLPIRFLHDVHAFLRGEALRGAAQGFERVAGVTLGTGLGFGILIDGVFRDNGKGSPHVGIYKEPWRGGVLEDFVSRRGLRADYVRRSRAGGEPDVEEIAHRAREGDDRHARAAFREMGRTLADALAGHLEENRIECLVLGGKISNAFDLFGEELEALRGRVPSLRAVERARDIDGAPLYGAAALIFGLEGLVSGGLGVLS
jgi:glucokinase